MTYNFYFASPFNFLVSLQLSRLLQFYSFIRKPLSSFLRPIYEEFPFFFTSLSLASYNVLLLFSAVTLISLIWILPSTPHPSRILTSSKQSFSVLLSWLVNYNSQSPSTSYPATSDPAALMYWITTTFCQFLIAVFGLFA